MKLTVVGCAGSYPTPESPGSCYLIEHDDHRILLDLGNGALGPLQQHVALEWPRALDAVILSHCHADHCADTAVLFVQRNYAPQPARDRLLMLGPGETRDRVAGVYGMTDPSPLDDQFEFRSFPREPVTVGPFTIETVRAVHPVESYSIRVTAGGRSLTYSGDTAANDRLRELARGTDVALFEASFIGTDNPDGVHMTGADAGAIARDAGAGLLLLTHLVSWNDPAVVRAEAVSQCDGPLEIAQSGMSITL